MDQPTRILEYLRSSLHQYPGNIVEVTAKHFRVTRTTVHRHLQKLISTGEVIKTGKTRDVRYYLASLIDRSAKFHINSDLEESKVYRDYLSEAFSQLPKNVESICHYGFTEIFNNAIDHSRGTVIWFDVTCVENQLKISILDDGIGVFRTIYDFFQLSDIYESVLQLSKGKMSTLPGQHSGEGLFFSSRAFDSLEIFANNIHYIRDNKEHDWTLEACNTSKFGSKIVMSIMTDSKRDLVEIFKHYQAPDELDFDRTDILVKLSLLDEEQLISRSQAKRILRGIDKRFTVVTLDFTKVEFVGQGFVDEIFRVYKNQHPGVEFKYVNANKDVEFMIKRGISTASSDIP